MKITSIIIDDEPLARKGLREYIHDVDFLELVQEFESPVTAMEFVESNPPQLIFLDIQMPKLTGMGFIKAMKTKIPVILTTAYPQFAVEGFELNALDYLVKPIAFERFLKAALKAKEYYEIRKENATGKDASIDHFFIKSDNKLVKIGFDEVLFVEALQNYVIVQTSKKKYITYLTIRSVEEYLPAKQFIRTHKSYIISAAKVTSIEGNDIRIGEHYIPVSRNLRDEVMERSLGGRYLKR